MTTTTENQTARTKQVPDFYIFENKAAGQQGGKPAGAAFAHKKGRGFTLVVAGKRYAAFPPKPKAPVQPQAVQPEAVQPEATEGKGA